MIICHLVTSVNSSLLNCTMSRSKDLVFLHPNLPQNQILVRFLLKGHGLQSDIYLVLSGRKYSESSHNLYFKTALQDETPTHHWCSNEKFLKAVIDFDNFLKLVYKTVLVYILNQ